MEYDIVDLKENEIPYKDAKIYPELDVKQAVIAENGMADKDSYRFTKRVMTHVPIFRDDIKYLIPYIRQFDCLNKDLSISTINEFEGYCISDCERIIDKYIIDNPIKESKYSVFRIFRYVK